MTPEEAQTKMSEWRVIEGMSVWNDMVEGLQVLAKMHRNTLERSKDDREMHRSQGAMAILRTVLEARANQMKELSDIIEGKHRTTARAARVS